MNYFSVEFGDGQRDCFESDRPIESDEELIVLVKERSERANSGDKFTIGVWSDPERVMIQRFLLVNHETHFSKIQWEFFAAQVWEKMTWKRVETTLKNTPEYDENDMETAGQYEAACMKMVGYNRANAYLKEAETRLLDESHEQIKKLPSYARQRESLEFLFEEAKTHAGIRAELVRKAASIRQS